MAAFFVLLIKPAHQRQAPRKIAQVFSQLF